MTVKQLKLSPQAVMKSAGLASAVGGYLKDLSQSNGDTYQPTECTRSLLRRVFGETDAEAEIARQLAEQDALKDPARKEYVRKFYAKHEL